MFDGEQNAIKLTMRRFSSINHRQVNAPLKISIKHCGIALIKPPLVPTTISFRNTRLKMENENRYERRHEWMYTILALIIKNKWVEEIFSRYLKKAISFHHRDNEYFRECATCNVAWGQTHMVIAIKSRVTMTRCGWYLSSLI